MEVARAWCGSRRRLALTIFLAIGLPLLAACGKDSPTAPEPPAPPPPPPTPVPTRIEVTPSSVSLNAIGQTLQLTAQVYDQNNAVMSGATVVWSSSDASVAMVSAEGLVTAAGNGSATITARSGSASTSVPVTVMQSAGSIVIEPSSATLMAIGEMVQLSASVLDGNGQPVAGAVVEWSSSDASVATVSAQGLVTAVANGSATVSARSGSASTSIPVTVMQSAGSIAIEPSETTLMSLGETVQLSASVLDGNGQPVSGAVVTWSSSDASVATVSAQGLLTAVANGSVTVTARSGGASASIPVTVMQSAGSIAIEPSSATLMALGETVQLSASVLDGNGQPVSGAVVTWSSSDASVATVSAQGLVTAVANGGATVTVRSGSASASVPVMVMQSAGSISIEPSSATLMAIGETVQLSASVLDGNGQPVAGATVEWSSSDEAVATVSGQGLVTAVANGSATVMARSGSASASIPVTVMQSAGSIAIEPSMAATLMSLGETLQLSATVLDGNGQPVSDATIEWLSSDEYVATVSAQGLVTAVANGSVTVTARSGGASASIPVTVMQSAGSIAIEPSMAATLMSLGETLQLSATVLDGNGQPVSDATIEWLSSDASVAIVSGTGLVTAVGNGSATITARSGSASTSIPVSVMQSAGSIVIEPSSATLMAIGETVQLSASVLDGNGQPVAGATVEWSSSDEAVATVSGQGLVTAVGNGSATVTAKSGSASTVLVVNVVDTRIEREVLNTLYHSTDGPNWVFNTNWLSDKPLNEWYGVSTDSLGRVTSLRLYTLDGNKPVGGGSGGRLTSNGLSGSIPPELGQLESLVELDLLDNELSGSIPPELGNLSKLRSMSLGFNQLSGSIPPELGNLTNLLQLGLGGNQLSGSIPSELGSLTNLWTLNLGGNQLSGSIPPEFGNLANLVQLNLTTNQLSGSIPDEIGQLQNLVWLDLYQNHLTGSIPHEIAQLRNLNRLDLSVNKLTGSIPPELGQLENLASLNLGWNQMTGNIPPELGQLQNLRTLHLGSNHLTGSIPPELGQLMNLSGLVLYGNKLTGNIPPELRQLTNLKELYLYGNQLTGNIPPDFGNLQTLEVLNLFNNQLTGRIPPELGQLQNLRALYLGSNRFTGRIPPELGQLQYLRTLYLSGNRFSGCLPQELRDVANNDFEELGLPFCGPAAPAAADSLALVSLYNATGGPNWTNNTNWLSDRPLGEWYGVSTSAEGRVSNLNLRSNQLTGRIPPELGQLVNLAGLFLWDNSLTGSIPPELGQLQYLEYLSLSDNQLTGRIPPELGQLQNLVGLVLFSNELTDRIPPELGQLQNLRTLSLGSNELTGRIPPEIGRLHNLTGLSLANNRLTGSIPPELGQLRNLTRLSLLANSLSGRIPPELGQLQNLRSLSLHSNSLTGSIPPELGKLHELTELYLAANRLTGSIPSELGQLENLIELYLGQNQLTGCIPTVLRDVESNDLADLGLSFCDPE